MDDDLDSLLDEFEKSYCNVSASKKFQTQNEDFPSDKSPVQLKKCFPPYLGAGPGNRRYQRPCSSLRCIQCDFKVIAIASSRWQSNIDYLFLRNNMPDLKKIKKKVEPCEGSTAYACQCKHYSADDLIPIGSVPSLQWVCCGHSNS